MRAAGAPDAAKTTGDDVWREFDVGYGVAHQGEQAIRDVLKELQNSAGAPMDGPKRKFGDLYDRLAYNLLSDEYRPFRQILRDHIATTWPLGPGDDLMREPVHERRVHSVLTAARACGVDARRLRKLLADGGWVRPSGEGREHTGELFDAIAAAPFLRSLVAGVSASKLQRALNLSRPQFELLQRDGYLQPMLGCAFHGRWASIPRNPAPRAA